MSQRRSVATGWQGQKLQTLVLDTDFCLIDLSIGFDDLANEVGTSFHQRANRQLSHLPVSHLLDKAELADQIAANLGKLTL